MKSDLQILEELEQLPIVSVPYIQRKYKLTYEKSRELKNRWVANEPKEPTFEEKFQKWHSNPGIANKMIKNRSARFFINGKFFDTWKEAEVELNKTS